MPIIKEINVKRLGESDIKKIRRNAKIYYNLPANSRLETLYRALGTYNPAVANNRMTHLYNINAEQENVNTERINAE